MNMNDCAKFARIIKAMEHRVIIESEGGSRHEDIDLFKRDALLLRDSLMDILIERVYTNEEALASSIAENIALAIRRWSLHDYTDENLIIKDWLVRGETVRTTLMIEKLDRMKEVIMRTVGFQILMEDLVEALKYSKDLLIAI